jgi:predicted MPP superfamily phosphohydrolase
MTRLTMMIIFGSVMTCIVAGVHYYLWRRLVKDTALPGRWRRAATGVVIFLGLCLPLTMILGRSLPYDIGRSLLPLPFVWMGVMMLLFWGFVALDGIKLVSRLVMWLLPKTSARFDPEKRQTLKRVAAGGALVAVGGLAGCAVYKGKLKPRVISQDVSLKRLPRAFDGFRIAQLTDLHIGNTLDGQWLAEAVAETNALKADLIAITGDVVDGYVENIGPEIASLSELRAPHGVYLVTGNHEYYSGVTEWIPVFEKLGIRVLRNEGVAVTRNSASFSLIGIDDFNAKRMAPGHGPDLDKALASVPKENETVLLAHQPRAVFEASEKDVGLVLSGHTHGGQMWPITHLVGLQQPYSRGLFTHGDRTQIYVSQGTGFWGPPMRLGTENEISSIRLRAG